MSDRHFGYLYLAILFGTLVWLLLSLAHAEAGCNEICNGWHDGAFTQVNPHCCCEDFHETPCHCAPQPTATFTPFCRCCDGANCFPCDVCVSPTPCAALPTPTPLPTPEDHVKKLCCKEAITIYRDAKRTAWDTYRAAVFAAGSRKRDMVRGCQEENEHGN